MGESVKLSTYLCTMMLPPAKNAKCRESGHGSREREKEWGESRERLEMPSCGSYFITFAIARSALSTSPEVSFQTSAISTICSLLDHLICGPPFERLAALVCHVPLCRRAPRVSTLRDMSLWPGDHAPATPPLRSVLCVDREKRDLGRGVNPFPAWSFTFRSHGKDCIMIIVTTLWLHCFHSKRIPSHVLFRVK